MKKSKLIATSLTCILLLLALLITGCSQSPVATTASTGPKKVKIGYSGGACEAFIFSAFEKGLFKEEGLDVELVKVDFDTLKESLATGKIDASSGMVMKWVKPFEQGVDAVFTSGIHTGCIQILVKENSNIKNITDLKGKVIANNGMGDGPMILASRAMAHAGLDFKKDVQWKAYPASELEGVLNRGEADAIALTDPMAEMVIAKGSGIKLLDTAHDMPYHDEYCCMATISGKLYRTDPATAAAITRGMMKGAKWVQEHQDEAAKLIIDKKYIPGDAGLVARLLKSYNYIPSLDGGEKAVDNAVREMKAIGVLDASTDVEQLKKKIFVRLPGVQ
ncbi:ABC transporter substrate-binding protein [Pelosinus sp. UFO1]|uniref:ABC transporter substrate-binding protein n=1 Tax=Pelosinus sp. UFO1 TaxID=484770 RepID=UPI0004D1E7EC|nr:ABC transporter substrate-binding protein [Pelosinus sp. UFO1]AIF52424.1 ABC-type transporter, periplasmic subunit family 3 [Pelosinus sp. UFO1]